MSAQETISASELRARIKKAPKYRNRKTTYNGTLYDSKREAAYAATLDLRQRAGEIIGWDRQVLFRLVVNGVRVTTYRADFVVHHRGGRKEVVDTKGVADRRWPMVRKLMLACYGIEVTEA